MRHRRGIQPDPHPRSAAAALLALLALAAGLTKAYAHGDVHLQIELITPKIESAPTAELHVKRADLHRLDENFMAALADLERAEKINPALDTIFMTRGRTQFEAGRFEQAIPALNRLLEAKPDHPEGLIFRARSYRALDNHAEALKDYDHLVAVMPLPAPDCFLERAASLVALKRPQDAVRSLDEGIDRLGNLTVLQQAAMQIEVDVQHYDAALVRTESIMAVLQRKEVWLERRGDILAAADRKSEALKAYADALNALALLPEFHRHVQPMRELEARLKTHLGAQASNVTQFPTTNQANTTSP
jgi:tetratricopeptide (TPR) repeat protein